MLTTSSSHNNGNKSTQSSIFPSLNQSRHQQSKIRIKSLPLQLMIEEEEELQVSQILDSKIKREIMVGALMEERGPGTQESRTHLEGSKR
ncbi:hypothetical protein O181_034631 [Austropuccinia psidii MF-1]|uniref:Uncharacterized protein n=1 Tax=Austropuccinia psidii MF-1 TaxID=1389203 RepID=A0A9Q3D6R5_9BASI|nr:hypothetical protein [Austropuccinia psidii MF-1]